MRALFLKLEMIRYCASSFPKTSSRKLCHPSSVATAEPDCNFRPLACFALTGGLTAQFGLALRTHISCLGRLGENRLGSR